MYVALEWVKEVHRQTLAAGLEQDVRVSNALVHVYAETGSIDDALLVFDRIKKSNVVTWNIMISGLADHGRGHEAYELFFQMQRQGFELDAFTYMSILNACARMGALKWLKDVHSHIQEVGLVRLFTCMLSEEL